MKLYNNFIAILIIALFSPFISANNNQPDQAQSCPRHSVAAIGFRVASGREVKEINIRGIDTVADVKNILAEQFPNAKKLFLSLPGQPGWINLNESGAVQQEIFLCKFHKKFGIDLRDLELLALIENPISPSTFWNITSKIRN